MPEQLGLFDRPDLTWEELSVYRLIKAGRENALSVRALCTRTGMSDYGLRMMVKHMIEEHGILVCSATCTPTGYYLPRTSEEYKAGAAQIVGRIRSLARRLRAMDKEAFETIFGNERLAI